MFTGFLINLKLLKNKRYEIIGKQRKYHDKKNDSIGFGYLYNAF